MSEIENMLAAIEALLFTMGKSLTLKEIAATIEHDEVTTRKLLNQLMDSYEKEGRGIRLIELDGAYQLCTKPEYYQYIIKLMHRPKKHALTEVQLETLSIIAYKQPVTKSMIEQIRGVSSDHAVNRLLEYNLVCEVGRLDAPGRPILFGTTEEFLRTFGIKSQDELPVIDPVKLEELKSEAREEIELKLEV